jgi:hypothetical protein
MAQNRCLSSGRLRSTVFALSLLTSAALLQAQNLAAVRAIAAEKRGILGWP